jgi:hypothetical protein
VISAYPGSDDEMICIANCPIQDRSAGTVEEEASVVGTSEAVERRGVFEGTWTHDGLWSLWQRVKEG